jgi:hypothetical protein
VILREDIERTRPPFLGSTLDRAGGACATLESWGKRETKQEIREMEPIERIERLERRLKLVSVAFVLTLVGLAVGGLRAQRAVSDDLRVRRITVVDEKGTERIWIGAPVPDPIVQGKRGKRTGTISGMILLDANGNERAGFSTADLTGEVFIGLDSDRGQETRFLVNPSGGGHLSFFDDDGNYARIGVLRGRPTLFLREKGEVVFEQPPR